MSRTAAVTAISSSLGGTGASRARLDREKLDREVASLALPELHLPTMLSSDAIASPYARRRRG